MKNKKKQRSLVRLLLFCLFSVLQGVSPAMAQCPIVVGGSDFYDKAHSDTIWAGDFNLVETVGPSGSSFSSSLAHADSAQAFMDPEQNVYGVTTNPHLLDSTYIDVDQNMLVVHISEETPLAANTKLFSYKISGIEKGSSFKITFDATCVNGTEYGIGANYVSWDSWELEAGVDCDQYGKSSCDVKETVKFKPGETTQVTLEGKLTATQDYIILDFLTGYNFKKGMSIGISNLRVEGCYKPHVMSNQGLEVCRGEQVLISLDKDYNADTYEWFMSDDGGKTFSPKGNGKNLYVELLEENYGFYCLVNGVKSDILEVKTIICCVDASGMPMSRMDVFFDDFGYFDGLRSYTDASGKATIFPDTYAPERADIGFDMSSLTGMKFDSNSQINDGFYGVVVPNVKGFYQDITANSRAEWMAGVSSDHSSLITGKAGGGALFMNTTKMYIGTIFSRQIDGLCTDKNIFFETYIANMSGGYDPEVTINIKDASTGKLLGSAMETAKKDAGWIRVHIDDLQISASSIILEIVSSGGVGLSEDYWNKGNDLIIDDIRFMVCSPPSVDVYSDLSSFASDTTICSDTDFEMGTEPSELLKNFFDKNPFYLFQHSTDGETWENIGTITNAPLYKFNTADFPADTNHFRVVVAKEGALKVFLADPNGADYDDKCRNYSISKSFKIIRAGSIDMGKDLEVSECGGLVVNLNGSNDGTLVRWSWEDADGKILVATTSDEESKVYDYKVVDDAVLTFTGYNKDGCMGKRKFTITKKNTVEFTVDSTMECDKTVISISDAPTGTSFTWFYDGKEMTETGSSLEFDTNTVDGELKVIGNATGLCESDTSALDITVHKTPTAPTPLATEAQEQVKKGESFSYGTLVPDIEGLQWASSESGPWSSDTASQSLDAAGSFSCFIRVLSEDGCPSEAVELILTINSAPMPTVANDTVCVGTEVDFTKYIVKSNEADGFKLAWYESETATSSTDAPVAKTAAETDDVLEYWVSQKNDQAESDKANIKVVVAKVAKPVVSAVAINYCYNETATELSASVTPNESKYIFASGTEWRDGTVVMTNLVPSTSTPGSAVYSVYGKYDVANAKNGATVCYSEPTDVTVTVVKVEAPATTTVNYLKTDADDNGGKFKDLMAQSNNTAAVPETGCTLKWYDADKNPLSAVPAPVYNDPNGGDVEIKYYVSQVNGKCESELAEVLVVISASPMPVTAPVAYCESATAVALTASISTTGSGSDKVSDYTLVWYKSNPNDEKTDAGKAALELPAAPVPSTAVTNGETSQEYTYYVAQKKQDANGKDVVSRATPLVVTVYAKPVLTTTNPAAVCEPATINLSNKDYWKVEAAQVTTNAYFDEDKTTKYPNPNAVSKTGTYYVEASFMVNNEECKSTPAPIEVTVDYIRDLVIDGDLRACPGESASLKAVTSAFSLAAITYTWTSSDAGETVPTNKEEFSTTALAGPAGKKYTYTLSATAGACTVNAEAGHTITIGDGPINGTLAIAETGNTESNTFTMSDADNTVTFKTCGGDVTITPTLTATLNDYAWTVNGASAGSSSVLTIPAKQSGDYVLTYTNGCKTSVSVKVISVPLAAVAGPTSALQICEGDDFSTSVIPSCGESSYKIAWFKDGVELADFADKKEIGYTPATANNNGVYSYKLTNNGCTAEGVIGEGNPLKVKPYIQLSYEREYVAPRGSSINIPLTITVPKGSTPANVIWYENGIVFDKGTSIDLKVNSDYKFKVILSDDDYCDATAEILVHKDAKLQMGVTVDDVMCQGDTRDLVIDTTGSGKFYYNGMQGIIVTENTATFGDRVYKGGWIADAQGKLHLSVSPVSDARYTIRYFYMEGLKEEQELSTYKDVKVLDPVNLIPPTGLSVCGDGEALLEIPVSVSPAGTLVIWDEDPSITSGIEGASVVVAPEFDANTSANFMTKTYIVRGTYSICSEVKMPVNITVVRPLKGEIVAPEGICDGMSVSIDASSYQAAEYVWNYDTITVNDVAVLHVTPDSTMLYEVEMTRGECSATDEFEVIVAPRPTVASIDSVYYDERIVVVSDGTPDFTYWLDNNKTNTFTDPHLVDITYGKHIIHVIDNNSCETEASFYVSAPGIKIPSVLTPNGDGINDLFTTQIINDAFPNANIKIFDRWGKKLAEYKGSEDGWDGTYNGQPMPSTDYWYEIEVKELKKTYTGHFTLMRQ